MEHLSLETISRHVKDKKLKGKSCLSKLITSYNEMTRIADEKRAVDFVYLEVSNAFDIVSHDILLCKLTKSELDKGTMRRTEN